LRYGQHFIEKNGSGVLAFINPHGFLDNPTFRGMRWHLLKTYDKIYTIDLHGNSKKKETSPDGSVDINVFDIQQGVSINLFVKTGKKKVNELGKVFHFDLFGKREMKYDFLNENSIATIDYKELPNVAPNYFFLNKDFDAQKGYDVGFSISELFPLNNVGIVTARDGFTIHNSKKDVENTISEFLKLDDEEARIKFKLGKDVRDWQVNFAKKDLQNYYPDKGFFAKLLYRPFDNRWTYYTGNTKGFHCYPRADVMKHFLRIENIGIVINKPAQGGSDFFSQIFLTKTITDQSIYSAMSNSPYVCPLYLSPENNGQQTIGQSTERTPNLNAEIVKQIADKLGLTFTNEKEQHVISNEVRNVSSAQLNPEKKTESANTNEISPYSRNDGTGKDTTFAPIDILDYIYAVLHSPTYREKYKEFLKIDFPRVPFPKDKVIFWQLVKLGGEIRQIHLLESPTVEKYITQYPIDGNNVVVKPKYENGKVYINDTQYFANVPQVAWEFYIGGYQPAQKWLKDRKERTLEFDDILHYQKIIVALSETDRLMKEIEKIEIE
jgi:predicted helicase